MHWELQDHHRLIPNERTFETGLDENSWMHGSREELCSLISKSVRYSKHLLCLLITCTSSGLPWGLWPDYWQNCPIRNFHPSDKAPQLIRSWRVDKLQMDWIWVSVNPTRRLPIQDPDCNLPSSPYIDDDDRSGKYNDFQSLIWYWWPEKVTSPLVFVT